MNDVASNFMKLDYIRNVGSFTELDPYLSSEYLPLNQTYVGIAATDSMQELEDAQEPSDNIDLFYQSCRNYYIVLIKQIKDRFKFEDEIYDILALVEPRNARNLNPRSLRPLFVRFPVLTEKCSLQKTDVEWRSQAMTDVTELHLGDAQVEDLSVEQYWKKILGLKTRSGEIKYPELRKCISLIFSSPFSNVPAERLFSLLKLIKKDIRNSMKNVTLVSLIRVNY